MSTDLAIVTTVSSDSVSRLFGPAGAMDFRSDPGMKDEYEDPKTIFNKMKQKDVKPLSDISMLKGTIYNYKNRRIITRWLRDVCGAFNLRSTTLCLAVQLADSYIVGNLQQLELQKCQLAAVTALWIAAKFEEMDADLPNLRAIVDVCDGAYSKEHVLGMEEAILGFYKWYLPHTTVVNHVYLQLHLMNDPALIDSQPEENVPPVVSVEVLVLDANEGRTWVSLLLESHSSLQDCLDQLFSASNLLYSTSTSVFQLFGSCFLLAERLPLTAVVGNLPLDGKGCRRLFLCSSSSQITSTFAERGSYVILRSINSGFLDLCDILTQEVVTHVEFLRLYSYVTAFGVVGLALCLVSPDKDENKRILQHVHNKLEISATQGLAVADLLTSKYKEALPTIREGNSLPRPPENFRDTLCYCFHRRLS
ncbi:putative mitotic cyclin [Leishmania major strain Friedlin]|uniref:Putative mitotic cyclin n=1 Tax=Leishmania major TaxID=5664 RepID=Q4Q7U8_LEIMA|nr:putative mitotic cyclin [Leishmania major strain Friedlin]CAG9578102.1 mitotic_cyclin_-_putative [Leishmania major strain Friedlin]CAJ05774.1 putative mitotic cyclin [Leishmania major strain Friedlin]|eukprot:XP_001684597.1 putative mitotic cyclin [Leishmania major strain Friedlin]